MIPARRASFAQSAERFRTGSCRTKAGAGGRGAAFRGHPLGKGHPFIHGSQESESKLAADVCAGVTLKDFAKRGWWIYLACSGVARPRSPALRARARISPRLV